MGAWQVFPITLGVAMEHPVFGGQRGEESAQLPGCLGWLRAGQEPGDRAEHRQGEPRWWLEREFMAMPGGKQRSIFMGHVLVHPPSPAPRCACTYCSCCRLPSPLCFQRYFQHGKFYLKGIFPLSFFSLWMRSKGAVKCRVSHLAEPEEMMLTKSLIYPIAAVTGISFWRWTEKLEWTRWTLAWEKTGMALPPLPKLNARQS